MVIQPALLRRRTENWRTKRLVEGGRRYDKNDKISLRVPYTDEVIKRRISRLLNRTGLRNKLRIWYDSGRSLRRKFHPPKEKPLCPSDCSSCILKQKDSDSCFEKNLIYQITCNLCNNVYFGETCRMIGTRIREHVSMNNPSAVKDHFILSHPQRPVSVVWRVVHRSQRRYYNRKCLERQYINSVSEDLLINKKDFNIFL